MRIFFLILSCMLCVSVVQAAQTCNTTSIPASTPDSQLTDNGDGTITDSKTGLMWKQCLEGLSGDCTGTATTFTWQEALQQPGTINDAGGFAGYTDWRLPNIRELLSIVEKQCYRPAINATRFPNTPSSYVWSGSPVAGGSDSAWSVFFGSGYSNLVNRSCNFAVRLVRGGQ